METSLHGLYQGDLSKCMDVWGEVWKCRHPLDWNWARAGLIVPVSSWPAQAWPPAGLLRTVCSWSARHEYFGGMFSQTEEEDAVRKALKRGGTKPLSVRNT